MFQNEEILKLSVKIQTLTWENLAQKVDFLLKVSMRELLMGGLHEVLAGVEEVLVGRQTNKKKISTGDQSANSRAMRCPSHLDGVKAAVLPGELQ